jgi:hypothetical protein
MTAPEAPQPLTADELRREIGRTREDLGETVAALVWKVDVKARTGARVRRWRAEVRSHPGYAVSLAAVVGAAIAAVAAAFVIGRRPG